MMTELYQSQRAMRQMRQQALQRGVVAILDIGSTKTACLVSGQKRTSRVCLALVQLTNFGCKSTNPINVPLKAG